MILRHLFSKHVNIDPEFECIICKKRFVHSLSEIGNKQIEIESFLLIRVFRFKLARLLKSHNYANHREKKCTATCENCGKSFTSQVYLNKHMLSHSDKWERLAQKKQCKHCGEWLMSRSGILYHQQIHTSGVQKCRHCEMELPNLPALRTHIQRFHRECNLKCSYCDKSYNLPSKLRVNAIFYYNVSRFN